MTNFKTMIDEAVMSLYKECNQLAEDTWVKLFPLIYIQGYASGRLEEFLWHRSERQEDGGFREFLVDKVTGKKIWPQIVLRINTDDPTSIRFTVDVEYEETQSS